MFLFVFNIVLKECWFDYRLDKGKLRRVFFVIEV